MSSAVDRSPEGTYVTPAYEAASGESADRLSVPPAPVHSTSVFSRSDGIIDWQPMLQPEGSGAENVEVVSSHLGMGWHPAVLYLVADRLAQPERNWQPFRPPAWGRWLYPAPAAHPRNRRATVR
jgi:hypothetical protein